MVFGGGGGVVCDFWVGLFVCFGVFIWGFLFVWSLGGGFCCCFCLIGFNLNS